MVERLDFLRDLLPDKTVLGLEVAPAHNPVCPKADGWNVTSVDCLSTAELIEYLSEDPGNDLTKVEPVDIVWQGGTPLHELVAPALHGKFKYIVASHVFEHIPDPVRFLQSLKILLAEDGFLLLALPERRYTFDYFKPLSTASEVMEAYYEKRTRHSLKNALDYYLYSSSNNGVYAWRETLLPTEFWYTFPEVEEFYATYQAVAPRYIDMHAWIFNPASFQLLMLDLALLKAAEFSVDAVYTPITNEFFTVLKPMAQPMAYTPAVEQTRFELALASIREFSAPVPEPIPLPVADPAPIPEEPVPVPVAAALPDGGFYHLSEAAQHMRAALRHGIRVARIAAKKALGRPHPTIAS